MDRPSAGLWAGLLCLVAMWGGAFLLNQVAVSEIAPLTISAMRVWIGLAVMAALLIALKKGLPSDPRHWAYFLLMASVGTCLPFFLVVWGQQFVSSSEAGILMAVAPLEVVLLAHFLLGDRLTWLRATGFALGFVGVVLLFDPASAADLLAGEGRIGKLSILAGATCYAFATILAQRAPGNDPYATAVGVLIAAAVLMVIALAISGNTLAITPSRGPLLALVALGVFATGGATVLYFSLARRGGAAFLSLTNYLVPCCAVALGTWVAGEQLALRTLAALGVILLGIAISHRPWKPTTS